MESSSPSPPSTPTPTPTTITTTTDNDKVLRKYYTATYPNQVGYILLSFILLLGIVRLLAFVYRLCSRRKGSGYQPLVEDPSSGTRHRDGPGTMAISLRRLPLALINAYRTFAFRTPAIHAPVLGGHSEWRMNVAEVGLTVVYLGVVGGWAFARSEYSPALVALGLWD